MTADRMIIPDDVIREKIKASTGHQPASLPWIMDARSSKDCITLTMTASANVPLLYIFIFLASALFGVYLKNSHNENRSNGMRTR